MNDGFFVGLIGAALLAAVGCGAEAGDPGTGSSAQLGCTPDEVFECACPDGTVGSQVCAADGESVSACGCGSGAPVMPGTGGTTSLPPSPTSTGGSAPAPSPTPDPTSDPTSDPTDPPTDPTTPPDPTTEPPPDPPPSGSCCADGNCYCRGPEPTEQSATVHGPFEVGEYADGYRDGPMFLGGTIHYPIGAEPPFAGVVVCPGWTALESSIKAWGPFLASHGIVTMTIDTNTTGDWVDVRAEALWDALTSLKEENTRPGSPLEGQLSPDRYGLMGWSMGGGGTWIDAAQHPELKTAISLAGHHATAGGAAIAAGATVPSMQFAGALDTPILGGGGQSQEVYEILPATTPKILYEIASADHFAFGTPTLTAGGALGRYGLAFQKVFLEGDERYRFILLTQGPDASDWRSNVQ